LGKVLPESVRGEEPAGNNDAVPRSAVAALALTATLLVVAGCSDDPGTARPEPADDSTSVSDETSGTATPGDVVTPTRKPRPGQPTPVAVPEEVAEDASDSATDYSDAVVEALGRTGRGDVDLSDLPLAGVALEALQAQAEEYQRSGWHVTGRPRVTSVEVYEHTDDEMVIGACIDESRVVVRDQRGRVVADGADKPRSLNILTLSRDDDGWIVVGTTFPSDPDC
jgi:hypothetical protein